MPFCNQTIYHVIRREKNCISFFHQNGFPFNLAVGHKTYIVYLICNCCCYLNMRFGNIDAENHLQLHKHDDGTRDRERRRHIGARMKCNHKISLWCEWRGPIQQCNEGGNVLHNNEQCVALLLPLIIMEFNSMY